MADEDKTIVEAGDGDTQIPEEGQPKKSGGNKLILFGGIGVGAIVIGIVLALFVIKPMMASDPDAEGNDEATEEVAKADDGHGEKKSDGHKKPKKSSHGDGADSEVSEMYSISDIVVNPAGTGGSRYLSVSFSFDLESPEVHAAFDAREPAIRDALITILSSKTVAQLTDAKQKEIVRYQIKKRISKLLRTDELAAVYYTDFVLQ
ncbi:MAG: flagellar basal body-associated FliL family protein [candidate division Zixibacteria bacterium]|nr:flagellar basal body-associated FliL family protein [candidate division Zixibacteria bacterium]